MSDYACWDRIERKKPGALLYNAEGLIREALYSHSHQLPEESVEKLYRIWSDLKQVEYGK